MLCDRSINELAKEGLIEPFEEPNLQPSSYDLTLGDSIICLDISEDRITIPYGKWLVLEPNDFILATTIEKVRIPNDMVARVEGKSSLGRIGLLTHITAGFIDAGFEGNITLELKNIGPKDIALKKGSTIAQICFDELDDVCLNPYNQDNNHYQNQKSVVKSRYGLENGIYFVD